MEKVLLNHVAVQNKSKKESDLFFEEILEIPKVKEFDLSKDLSEKIFGLSEEVKVCVYDNTKVRLEVFITNKIKNLSFDHICINVSSKEELIEKCKKFGLEIRLVDKGEKTLLFIKDFSENIYEIKS